MRGRSKTTKPSVHVLHWAEQPVSTLVGMATAQRAQTRLNIRATAAKTKSETGDGLKQVMTLLIAPSMDAGFTTDAQAEHTLEVKTHC